MAKVCIICEKEVSAGHAVMEDPILGTMRAIKRATRTAKNNTLMVCSSCVGEYQKKRAAFERTFATYLVIAAVFVIALVAFPLFTTGFSICSLVLGLVFGAFILVIPVLSSYSPRVEGIGPLPAKGEPAASAKEVKKGREGAKKGKRK